MSKFENDCGLVTRLDQLFHLREFVPAIAAGFRNIDDQMRDRGGVKITAGRYRFRLTLQQRRRHRLGHFLDLYQRQRRPVRTGRG